MSRSTTRSAGVPRRRGRRAATLITLGLVGAAALTGCSAGQVAETAMKVPAIQGIDATVGDIAVRDALIAFPAEGVTWPAGSDVPLRMRLVNNGASADRLVSASADLTQSVQLQVVPEGGQSVETPSAEPSAAVSESASPSAGETTPAGATNTPSGAVEGGTPTPTLSNGQPSPAPSRGTPSPVVVSAVPTASPGTTLPLEIPAGKFVALDAPGPQLVMVSTGSRLDANQMITVTLKFEKAGDVSLTLPFAPPGTPLPRTSLTHSGEGSEE
ncbi:hypothetical protein [Cryptosporangium phraense]|uniref:Copper chaperone PCu(A)C n=1 Tax=Cryptosporangium phraense TaxID=2593070 RepID=A0A545AFE2_9ACTN|nr:hypothetical protein [Cryptosporangium phraense]TQS40052.1 hypothetical protein FL583_36645 [Cryptosporangium phraense]